MAAPADEKRVDFVAVGHVTRDMTDDGWVAGGSALYAAITASRMGLKAGIVTSFGPDFAAADLPKDVSISSRPSESTTTFQNRYGPVRTQRVFVRAEVIRPEIVPPSWRNPSILLLCPVIHEVEPSILDLFSPRVSGVMPQGWLRRIGTDGVVTAGRWENREEVKRRVDVLFLSQEDLGTEGEEDPSAYAAMAKVVIITMGAKGALLHSAGRSIQVPPRFAKEVDPTGAGDVFAASFLAKYLETGNPVHSANYASIAAAISVESVGLAGIPDRIAVDERMHHG